jgi:hypothetical protein
MSKTNITTIEPIPPQIKPINAEAVNYLSWFMADANNLRNWSSQLFSNNVDTSNPYMLELKESALQTIIELEDDIIKIKDFLDTYVPSNNN